MKPFLLFSILLILMSSGISIAQPTNDLSLHVYGVWAIPEGDFAKNLGKDALPTRRFGFQIGDKVGLAKSGYGCGLELMSAVGFKGLNWIFSVNYLLNSADDTALEPIYQANLSNADRNVPVDFQPGHWINIPILSGFRYDYRLFSQVTVYALIQGGMNFSRRPSQKVIVDIQPTAGSSVVAWENILAEDTKFDFARDFGYGAGFGFIIGQRFNLGLRYYNLSHPKYNGTRILSENVFPHIFARKSQILGEERSVSMMMVTLGINLF